MGEIVMAAKITHVPSIWMSHTIEKFKGIRDFAIDGYASMREQAIAAGVETFVVFDTHWIVNQGFHLNSKPEHKGKFISHELPHMLSNMDYDYQGDTELGDLIEAEIRGNHDRAISHKDELMGMEYGTLVPMHFINEGKYANVLPVAVNQFSSIEENRVWGAAIASAIKKSDRKVAVLASGSLSHAFWPNMESTEGLNTVNGEFNEQVDRKVLELWEQGRWEEFLDLLPEYAVKCVGECAMNDTALLFGALGWKDYAGKSTTHTPYFGSSGTGQVNITFSV
jgi:3,4-dihydroxyphenylacetate 2,3-dioxygenase